MEETRQKRAHNRVFRLEIVCQGCGVSVVGSSGKRKYCTRKCGSRHRDKEIRAYHRAYHQENREKKNEASRQYRRERGREQNIQILAYKYGVTVEWYCTEIAKRDGLCDICGEAQAPDYRGIVKALSVDHDHLTGQVRGFLCSHCNIALGAFKDNPESMRVAAAYIERNRGS